VNPSELAAIFFFERIFRQSAGLDLRECGGRSLSSVERAPTLEWNAPAGTALRHPKNVHPLQVRNPDVTLA
jgi:hypothetical protein